MAQTITLPSQTIFTRPLQPRVGTVMPPVPPQGGVAPLTQREIRSLPLSDGEQAVATFMATHPQCGSMEQISRFMQLVKAANWRGIDITSVIRTLGLGGTVKGPAPSAARTRVGGMELTEQTMGKRGKRKDQRFPSLLWQIILNNCGDLDSLNIGIESVMQGNYGLTVPVTALAQPSTAPPSSVEVNQALTQFFTAHPECKVKQSAINQLLNMIDDHQLTGRDIFALFRTLGLEGHLPVMPTTSGYRVAGLSISPTTPPLRGQALEKQQMKMSLLWMLLSEYCGVMDEVVTELNNILSGQIEANRLRQPGPLSSSNATADTQPVMAQPAPARRRTRQPRQRASPAVAATPIITQGSAFMSPQQQQSSFNPFRPVPAVPQNTPTNVNMMEQPMPVRRGQAFAPASRVRPPF